MAKEAETGAATGPPEVRGSNQSGMRAHNERLVLSLLRRHGALPKAAIARMTGLSAQTVSVIMRRLENEKLLIRDAPVRGKVGQPSIPMRLNPEGALFFGLKVGRRSSELVLCDFLGRVRRRASSVYAYPTPEATALFARQNVEGMLAEMSPELQDRVAGLGIAIPFFLWNWARALRVPERQMASWRDADIRADIADRVAFPVYLENDASVACSAELVFGPADGPRDFLYFYLGYFAGGGIALGGRLFTGQSNAGALGPMPVPGADGTMGQLLDVASLSVLESRLKSEGVETDQLWHSAEDWSIPPSVLDAWVADTARAVAHSVICACSVIDFRSVKIDGFLPSAVRDDLVAAVNRELDRADLTGLIRPTILPGTLGADARALGAASLPLTHRFSVR